MNPADKTIAVHERFLTFQGEGAHMGRKAFFIRTMGCPVKCEWCDSAGTWHPDYVPKQANRMTLETLADEAKGSGAKLVVLTGGEPMVQPHLPDLSLALQKRGLRVHVETCGAFDTSPGANDRFYHWITVSPKRAHLPVKEMVMACHELKLIVDTPDAITEWVSLLSDLIGFGLQDRSIPVWLHPEWSQRDNPDILNTITQAITKDTTGMFRAGWQLHKLYRADALDQRSCASVPLGGDPTKGF